MNIERHWYASTSTWLSIILLPLSWLFRLVVAGRYLLYRFHAKKINYFPVPVIVVGNITVGGTGKTPMVIWLTQFLQKQGYHPGIVSRGVGGAAAKKPVWVNAASNPAVVGDEAVLIARRTQCPMVVCRDRVAAVRELLAKKNCDVVISDDGLQHYRLGRNIEIVMVDGMRKFGNQCMLPAGPLREPLTRLQRADCIVIQGDQADVDIQHQNVYAMHLTGTRLVAVKTTLAKSLQDFAQQKVHAVVGIGNPERFFAALRACKIDLLEHRFKDHYLYQARDFVFADSLPVLMTEKDAVKCVEFADERFWYLPVDAELSEGLGEAILQLMMRRK